MLGGLHIEHKMGPVAHSDGDALLHVITDAVLGALGWTIWGRSSQTTIPAGGVPHPINFYGRLFFRLRNWAGKSAMWTRPFCWNALG